MVIPSAASEPPYFADFACVEANLIVEVDGSQHSESTTDTARDQYLAERGWRVTHFWNNDVLGNTEGVLQQIVAALAPHPSTQCVEPPPLRGRGGKVHRCSSGT